MSAPAIRLTHISLALAAVTAWACAEPEPTAPAVGPEFRPAGTATYTLEVLDAPGSLASGAADINDAGLIVGSSRASGTEFDPQWRAVVWRDGVMSDLGGPADARTVANAVNRRGEAVGLRILPGGASLAVRWTANGYEELGTLGGASSEALDINDHGVIVGWSEMASGQRHAFIWRDGEMADLGTLGGSNSRAEAINDHGVVVGNSNLPAGQQGGSFRWADGVMVGFGPTDRNTGATDINGRGEIVGIVGPGPDAVGGEREDVFGYFRPHRGALDVFSGFRRNTVEVEAVNDRGVIVGSERDNRDADFIITPLVWEGGLARPLPRPVDQESLAYGVNRKGDVVGISGGHAVVWRRQ